MITNLSNVCRTFSETSYEVKITLSEKNIYSVRVAMLNVKWTAGDLIIGEQSHKVCEDPLLNSKNYINVNESQRMD